jgi:hypothetical protein
VDKSQKIRKRQQRPGLLRGLFKKFACSELIRDTKRRNLRRGLQLRIDNGWDPTGKAQIERIVQCAEVGKPVLAAGAGAIALPLITINSSEIALRFLS